MPRLETALRIAALLAAAALVACSAQTELHESASAHGRIIVTEDSTGLRTLMFDRSGARQTVARPDDPSHLELPYARVALAGLALSERTDRMLVVGLGGGSLPRFIKAHFPEASLDVVEIDPAVIDVAKKFFGFREDGRLRVHLADGRRFIEAAAAQSYDLVFLDAFDAEKIPAHLTTLEFLRAVRRTLRPGGVVVGNVWGPSSNALHDAMLGTYQEAFAQVLLLDVAGDVNRIFLALGEPRSVGRLQLAELAGRLSAQRAFRFDLGAVVRDAYRGPAEGRRPTVLRDP